MLQHWLKTIRWFVKTLFVMLKLLWEVQPLSFIGLIILQLLQGLLPLGTAWIMKLLFDLLANSLHGSATVTFPRTLFLLFGVQAGLTVVNQILVPLDEYLNAEVGRKVTLTIQARIYNKINNFVGLIHFEDPQLHDTIQLATNGAQSGPLRILHTFMTILREAVTITGFLGVLLAFSPLLAAIVGISVLPQLYMEIQLGQQRFGIAFGNSPKERLATYYGNILSSVPFAKEVRLFTLGEHFLQGFLRITREIQGAQRQQQKRELRWQLVFSMLSSAVTSGAFVFVIVRAFTRHLSLGDVILYTSAVASVQATLLGMILACAQVNESVLFYHQYTTLLALPQPQPFPASPCPVPSLTSGIQLCDVSFRYSSNHPWTLRHVNLHIPVGQCLALVGLNGAGKTTLVKLLMRMYDPTEGQILWNGINIRDFDPQELRQRFGAIFQDFMRYDLSAYENIALGDVTKFKNSVNVHEAAKKADIHRVIENLPQGYRTILSRWLGESQKGCDVDLSGGEWQKIALARMFMRNADLLILDEPTAALDANAEYDLHNRFVDLMAGRTSVLITHRFSTVRMADVIAVLEQGCITEYGVHDELLALSGTYARLYKMQAEQYQQM